MDEDNLVKAREISDPNRGADMGIAGGGLKALTPSERSVTKSAMNKARAFNLSFSLKG